MSTQDQTIEPIALPPLPVEHGDWISYVSSHPDTPMHELIEPYKSYDSKLREIFAQQPAHPAITTPNVVPLFAGKETDVKVRARDMAAESEAEREAYIMPLAETDRKPSGAPAIVQSIKEFQTNFQLFSESSLVDMDWSNVVVAGSAVVTSLLPVPAEHNASKRALREYYHQKLAPASDVDLFLYGLSEDQATEKIKQIEQRIKDSILTETTTIRTKNAITIASQYPTRHVQIVLRIYRSISEILTGFDVDCSCAAYDGSQVYASPRALGAYMTQVNTIDLTRRSPSYENRLSKYSRRGFEVYWPLLDRSRIDPTLFERSFGRTLGLARLLVLEKLPKNTDREDYVDQRRKERGRPAINRWGRSRQLKGNMKDDHDDEVAEWVETDEVSDYHTFTIPYGPKYHARKIERLLYAKDLLLNAEWNRPKDRDTALHRHPAFFGNAIDVIGDCCGYCPKPLTPEEQELADEEGKIYVTGNLSFIKDDPGRQAIGSFHPLTDDDWTEMAYVGNTARLCQAIVDKDIDHVQDWLSQAGADPNRRDYTGRTPLHLAVSSSTPEIVQCLIDADARITPRLFDGKTALHLAAMRGDESMVRSILIRSEANEEKQAEQEASKKVAPNSGSTEDVEMKDDVIDGASDQAQSEDNDEANDSEDEDIDMMDDHTEHVDATTENSIVKIERNKPAHENLPDDDATDDPDIYDVNVVAWDAPVSALHLAIANGHMEVVKVLVQEFGADVLLPIKLVHDYTKSARAAILPLVLALQLPSEKANEMTKVLIDLGASPAQADVAHVTALHYFATHGLGPLKSMIDANRPAAQRAVGHLSVSPQSYNQNAGSALKSAIEFGDLSVVDALLELGAKPEIDYATFIKVHKNDNFMFGSPEDNERRFRHSFHQPIFTAVNCELPAIVTRLLDAGADLNSMTTEAWRAVQDSHSYNDNAHSLLDAVRQKVETLRTFVETGTTKDSNYRNNDYGKLFPPLPLKDDSEYLEGLEPGTYSYWTTMKQIEQAKVRYEEDVKKFDEWKASRKEPEGSSEKIAAVKALLAEFDALEAQLVDRGAKTFKEMHPDVKMSERGSYNYRGYEPKPPTPWAPKVDFYAPDLTDDRRAGYVKLFQACWDADLPTLKELTLTLWGDNQTPLLIAVRDVSAFSPFAIAVLRGHLDIAKAVLEIVNAQYAPKEKVQSKHSLVAPIEDDDSDSASEEREGDDDEFQIYSKIVEDKFTIDNIGEIQHQARSEVTPLEVISWDCPASRFLEDDDLSSPTTSTPRGDLNYRYRRLPMRRMPRSERQIVRDAANGRSYHNPSTPLQEDLRDVIKPGNLFQFAICLGDLDLLSFLLTMGEDYTLRKIAASEDKTGTFFTFDEANFLFAIRLGRVQLLEEIIKRTGAGIPLDDLVKKSGVEVEVPEKPKFYQGLSVHGKKRADWANAGRQTHVERNEQHPPLLHAARLASIESVEWFLGDAAMRCYLQFANNHQDDARIQNLGKSKGGVQGALSSWLSLRSHLLLHCVVLGKSTEQSLDLIQYLCKVRPEALHHRSAKGMTPLQLAFSLHRNEMAKVLLEAGADQTCRNNAGDNIVHSILNSNFKDSKKDLPRIRELLGLIDDRLLSGLFTERTTEAPVAATPLARWLFACGRPNDYNPSQTEGSDKFVQTILDFSKGIDLDIVNGEGDTPLHAAIRYRDDVVLRTMLEARPELLFRENATGRTPYEMAEDAYLADEVFNDPPSLSPVSESSWNNRRVRAYHRRFQQKVGSITSRSPGTFVGEQKDERPGIEKVWEVCKEFAQKSQDKKRKLVSLVEANEVAKRLALQKKRNNGRSNLDAGVRHGNEEEKEEKEDVKGDEVDVWYNMGLNNYT